MWCHVLTLSASVQKSTHRLQAVLLSCRQRVSRFVKLRGLFAGELGKLELLQEGILHKCVKQLIERKKSTLGGAARISDMSEDIECLCEIMRTVGQRLDHDRARPWMDQYFERIRAYQCNPELPARIRFLLQDIIELRARSWQPRKLLLAEGAPKTIQQVRRIYLDDHYRMCCICFSEQ